MHELTLSRGGRLCNFVESIRLLTPGSSGVERLVGLPGAQVQLLVRRRDSDSSGVDAYVIGPRSRVTRKAIVNRHPALAVRFRPGAARIFIGVPLCELSDQVLPIEELWGDDGVRMREAIAGTYDLGVQVHVLEHALLARVPRGYSSGDTSTHTVRRAVRLLEHARDFPTVTSLARQLGISERGLRRAFNDAAGIAPKTYLRILRFRSALRVAQASATPRWSDVALDAGYYDQAHMIDEFRDFVAATPTTLLKEIAGDPQSPTR